MAGRLALLLTGVWLGALVLSWAIATTNFRTVDRVLGAGSRPELQERLAPVPPATRREAFRHLAAEINRTLFAGFGAFQLGAGVVLLLLLWKAPGSLRLLAAAVLGLVVLQLFLVSAITSLGRDIDFVARPLSSDVARRFGLLHGAFAVADLVKAGALVAMAALLARR
jgi:hypothetical protein